MKFSNISFNEITSSLRFDGSYHLSEGVLYTNKIQKMNFEYLGDLTSEIFTAGRTKRIYTSKEFGYPYLSNSDVSRNNPFDSCNNSSKKYGFDENSVLKEGMIVTGRVGAIGQTSYISSEFEKNKAMGSDNIIRIVTKNKNISGYVYAFLASKFGKTFFNKLAAGGVQPYISEDMIKDIPVPLLPETKQQQIHQLIVEASALRVEANKLLKKSEEYLYDLLNLTELTNEDYEYFGNHVEGREISTYNISIKEINPDSINAFNYSRKIKSIINNIKSKSYLNLIDCLSENGYFSTGSFKRLEVNSDNGIKLINQSDIFNSKKVGKNLSKRAVGNVKLVEYGEVLIAGVGTLGEGETFCRTIFANEELENQLVSGEFIRLKTNDSVPSGYLYCWLASDYGFRLIRSTQSGTKLCRPIPNLLKEIPIPIVKKDEMLKIDEEIKVAYSNFNLARIKENQAIDLIEKEIDAWQ